MVILLSLHSQTLLQPQQSRGSQGTLTRRERKMCPHSSRPFCTASAEDPKLQGLGQLLLTSWKRKEAVMGPKPNGLKGRAKLAQASCAAAWQETEKLERQVTKLRRQRDDAKLAFDKAETALSTCQPQILDAHKQALQDLTEAKGADQRR